MSRHYFLINLILIILTGLLYLKFYNVWTRPLDIPVNVLQKNHQKPANKAIRKKQGILAESHYDVIVEKNLFHPSRSRAKKNSHTPRHISQKEKPQLFGTIIQGKKKFAILEDPSTKKTNLYSINDTIASFVISDILLESVVLKRNDKSIQIGLRDDKKFKRPRKVRKTPKRIKRPRKTQRRRRPTSPRRRNDES